MSNTKNERHNPKQIAKYQTGKALVEAIDKLIAATPELYAHIHNAGGGFGGYPSVIGLSCLDYSKKGSGAETQIASANISPSEVAYLFNVVETSSMQNIEFKFEQQKIIAVKKDEDGRSKVTMLCIERQLKDNNGNSYNLPWRITIGNGTGIAVSTQTGGTMIGKNSFISKTKASIRLLDGDMFELFHSIQRYVELWEMAVAIPVIKRGLQLIVNQI